MTAFEPGKQATSAPFIRAYLLIRQSRLPRVASGNQIEALLGGEQEMVLRRVDHEIIMPLQHPGPRTPDRLDPPCILRLPEQPDFGNQVQ